MFTIRKSLLQLLFSGSYMRRWNDKLRPIELHEIDKQAHKMIVAWMLTLLNCKSYYGSNPFKLQQEVIEKGLFDYLYRLIITDIKPPVFYRICENEKDYAELTKWVLSRLRPIVKEFNPEFWNRLITYHQSRDRSGLADRILGAAHLYASGWEYNIIRPLNIYDDESQSIADSFSQRLKAMSDINGVEELLDGDDFFSAATTPLGRFARLTGQLRFQVRWASTPRIPKTTVLGHMFLVAAYAYCFSLAVQACPARCVNNFFAGLFHDLPELLTRDIITPVKRSIDQLPGLIREYELSELERRVFGPLTTGGYTHHADRLRYYLGLKGDTVHSEFDETVQDSAGVRRMHGFDELQAHGNMNELDPKDGILLKDCDSLAAFMEAYVSQHRGVFSSEFNEALARIRGNFLEHSLGPLSLTALIADFD